MTLVAADWTVAANGNIRYTGADHGGASPSYATVIEFHRWLQDLADDAVATGDDLLDITDLTPSERSTDNIVTLNAPYNIDDTAAEHIYDGSIIQSGGDVIYDGIVNFGNPAVQIQVIQNGAVLTDDWWNYSGAGLNANATAGISHRFMLKVRTAGADIDGRRLIGIARRFGYTYREFSINGTARGNNVFALSDAVDLNNQTLAATVSGWTEITNLSEGFVELDVNNDTTVEPYYSQWDRSTYTINQFYERMKWLTREGSSSTLYGLNGELFRGITHSFNYDNEASGPIADSTLMTWATGSGQVIAVDDNGTAGTIWFQLLTGAAPANNDQVTVGSATANVDGTVNTHPISTPFIGASTGSALIGAYGVGLQIADLSAADSVTDLSGSVRNPPNYVTFTVGGLVVGEDRVLVGPESGGGFDVSQLSASGAYSGAEATVTVQEAIPGDTPATGVIRVWNGSTYARVTYTGWSGSNFTGCTGMPAASNGADIWIAYIDKLAANTSESFTGVYQSNRNLFVRVRDGGGSPIKTFETTGVLGSAGGSTTAIRTSDA
jgi:hypothetical protein